jgi:hypothetical protein
VIVPFSRPDIIVLETVDFWDNSTWDIFSFSRFSFILYPTISLLSIYFYRSLCWTICILSLPFRLVKYVEHFNWLFFANDVQYVKQHIGGKKWP